LGFNLKVFYQIFNLYIYLVLQFITIKYIMVNRDIDVSTNKGGVFKLERLFPVEKEYTRCIKSLNLTGILTVLPKSGMNGVIGIDGKEYPVPTLGQVLAIFSHSKDFAIKKIHQGFKFLELTPMAIPISLLIDLTKAAIFKHASEGTIFQTRLSPSDNKIRVRVNSEKIVWVWDTLKQIIEKNELVYFPKEYSDNHQGQTKLEVINNENICAVPGWSVGLVENLPIMPQPEKGKILGGRKQLEIGSSPREYLRILQAKAYQGETGKTIEDFITEFLIRLETTNEVSNDRNDNNALWLLGQYVKYVKHIKSDLVPTGWWHRYFGRIRLDAHRPGNRLCTKSWGGSSTVRLLKP
jgi:hypothetical protein